MSDASVRKPRPVIEFTLDNDALGFCITTEAVNICLRRVCNEQRDTGESTYKKSRSTLQKAFPFLLEVKMASADSLRKSFAYRRWTQVHIELLEANDVNNLAKSMHHHRGGVISIEWISPEDTTANGFVFGCVISASMQAYAFPHNGSGRYSNVSLLSPTQLGTLNHTRPCSTDSRSSLPPNINASPSDKPGRSALDQGRSQAVQH